MKQGFLPIGAMGLEDFDTGEELGSGSYATVYRVGYVICCCCRLTVSMRASLRVISWLLKLISGVYLIRWCDSKG